tara:strand:- start:601 stop:837 length:237 start_codon:yes stop_codon:yes gene_type:complete
MGKELTLFDKALVGDFEIGDIHYNINRCKEISRELKILDIIDPSSRKMGLMSELLYRVQNMPELHLVEFDDIGLTEIN